MFLGVVYVRRRSFAEPVHRFSISAMPPATDIHTNLP
jgi:hypothetical protein